MTNILMTLDKLMRWTNANGLNIWKKPEAVGELYVPWCEPEQNHCPWKFQFGVKSSIFFTKIEKTQTPRSWWWFSVWTFYMLFFREEKANPKFGDLKERKSDQLWTLVIAQRSFTANYSWSSFDDHEVWWWWSLWLLRWYRSFGILSEYGSGCKAFKAHVIPLKKLV